MKNKSFRIIIIVTVALIILAIVGKRLGWFGKEELIEVATEKVTSRTITEMITANGKIQPETEVKISPDVSGEIVELYVKEGDDVKQGTLLVKIKPDTYVSMVQQAESALNSMLANQEQAKAQLMQNELSFNRNKQLWEQKAISQSDYESAEAAYNIAKANYDAARFSVKSAEARLAEARENLIKTTIYAPMSGTISKLDVEKGERVVGTSMMTGTELMRIADLEKMEAVVEVNENDIIRVNLGDTAIIEVDAYIDHPFRGVVTEIANSATTTGVSIDQVTSFNVKILILKESYQDLLSPAIRTPFRPGMSCTVDIQTETRRGVLSVPIQAVTTRVDSLAGEAVVEASVSKAPVPKEVVFVFNNDSVSQVEVKTGIQDNSYIEIQEGLKADEEVVIAPFNAISKRLKQGSRVTRVAHDKLFEVSKKK